MSENPRRGRQERNFTTNVSKIIDLKSSFEQIFFRKLALGAPDSYSNWINIYCHVTFIITLRTELLNSDLLAALTAFVPLNFSNDRQETIIQLCIKISRIWLPGKCLLHVVSLLCRVLNKSCKRTKCQCRISYKTAGNYLI